METQTMGLSHHENGNASDTTEVMLRRPFMRITWHQYPTLMASGSNACFKSAKLCTKSFMLLFRLIHMTIGLDACQNHNGAQSSECLWCCSKCILLLLSNG